VAVPLTSRRLNRATLARQLLLGRAVIPATDAVRRVVALQAQEAMSPYLALANRVEGFRPAELDDAFAGGSIVKASLMRITLHAVTAADYPVFHRAMLANLRASRLNDRRFAETTMTAEQADALVPDVVAFASTPRTRAEIEGLLEERLGSEPHERLWWALRTYAPLIHAPGDGPWSFGREPRYLTAPAASEPIDPGAALAQLVRRYLEGFGPASVRDFAQFSMQQRSVTRRALDGLAGDLVVLEGPAGEEYFDLTGAPLPDETVPAPPRLMAMWDSTLLAYADRSRLIPPEYRKAVIRQNGDVLPTVLVDGFVCGVWRPSETGIEVRAFHPLRDSDWSGLAEEAGRLSSLFDGRPPTYGRYGHWWKRLPAGDTRILQGEPSAD
jgi:hypothetical protein